MCALFVSYLNCPVNYVKRSHELRGPKPAGPFAFDWFVWWLTALLQTLNSLDLVRFLQNILVSNAHQGI